MEQSDSTPLLSIVIATRNRVPYAISAIQSILNICDPRLQLVVQDNSDSRELESYAKTNVRDPRFIYRYTPPPFSSIDNFNAAVELATGEYLCLIGDDDGVNPEILEAASWAKSNGLDSLGVRPAVHFLWPDAKVPSTLFTQVSGGSLTIESFRGTLTYADLESETRKLVHNGGLYYLNFKLPKLYHGLVHRSHLETIRKRMGAYIGGLSPDIFVSLAVACLAKRIAVIDYPLTIPGACGVSASVVEGAQKKHSKRLEDAPHFRDRGEYRWCEFVPRIYSCETIWVDSGVAALRAMGREDLVQQINLPKLAAHCILSNRGVMRPVLRDFFAGTRCKHKHVGLAAVQLAWSLLLGATERFTRRACNRLLMMAGLRTVQRIQGLNNMVQVSNALTRFLKESNQSFVGAVRRGTR